MYYGWRALIFKMFCIEFSFDLSTSSIRAMVILTFSEINLPFDKNLFVAGKI